jgi:ligand-binding SRPBCC domain-containing protein
LNAVAPNPVSNAEFTQMLGKVLHRPTILPAPAFAIKLALGDMAQILLSGQMASSRKIEDSGYKFNYPDLESALTPLCEKKGHVLMLEQWVPRSPNEMFDFFSDAKNLELLTPPYLKFKILRLSTAKIEQGTRLDYRLQLHGIRFKWQSLITEWQPDISFSDKQTKGPYAFWEHTHEFFEKDGGTVIRDRAVYEIPLWAPGDLLLHPFIRKDLEKIFAYRRTKIEELFLKSLDV